jgi:crossover junction endodeoxyribonuclease RuvC
MGIDPGSRKIGLALLETEGRKVSYLDSTVVRLEKIKEFNPRLKVLFEQVLLAIKNWQPDVVAIESLIFAKGTTSLMKMAQARGCILTALTVEQIPIFEYSPNLVKSTVAGHGHAPKESIQKILSSIFPKATFSTDDESDAVAIALCHVFGAPASQSPWSGKSKNRTLADSVKHRIESI